MASNNPLDLSDDEAQQRSDDWSNDLNNPTSKEPLPKDSTLGDLTFDRKNPAKTLASMANIPEPEAQRFVSELPLSDLIALMNAMDTKDLEKISEIVQKHKSTENQYHEALDYKVRQELGKISQKVSQQAAVNKTAPITPTPTGSPSVSTAIAANQVQGTDNVIDADSKSGTIVVQDPTTKKATIKNTNDPKNASLVSAIAANAGV